MPATAATRPSSSAEAGTSARRKTPFLPAMVVVAEGTRADAALTAGFSVSSSSVIVSFKRSGRWGGTGFNPAVTAGVRTGGPVPFIAAGTISALVAAKSAVVAAKFAARFSSSVVVVPVIKGGAPGVVPVVVISYGPVMPIGPPMTPAPPVSSVEADSEADSVRRVQPAIPDSGILVPSRPLLDGTSVNQPWIIFGDVNDFGAGRFDDDGRVLGSYGLLLRSQKIACFLRPLAHHLYGIHHVLFLVVVSVAERRSPGEVFVHVAQDGRECTECLDARVPGLLIHGFSQGVPLQIRMRLDPLVGLDDLLGKRRRSKDLGDKRIWIQRNRRYQLLQLLGSLLNVLLTLRGLRRVLLVLSGRQVLMPSHEQQRQQQQGKKKLPVQVRP